MRHRRFVQVFFALPILLYVGLAVVLIFLLSCTAHAAVDPCYRPPLPERCVPKSDQMGEHVRCLVVDRIKLLDYIRRVDAYHACKR